MNNNIIKLLSVRCFAKYYRKISLFRSCATSSDMENTTWKGVPLSQIRGSEKEFGSPEFTLVTPSPTYHSVLYHIPKDGLPVCNRPPMPQIGQDKWDHNYVKLPCSTNSLYPVEKPKPNERTLRERWPMIQQALQAPIHNSQELADAILSYNHTYRDKWKFQALHALFNEYLDEDESNQFFRVTLPLIARLALLLPQLVQSPIPLLKQNENRSVSLSQEQIACLLANAFFCTYPRRNTNQKKSEYGNYPNINFTTLYESTPHSDILQKLKCLFHYLGRVSRRSPVGVVTFSRRYIAPEACPPWPTVRVPVASVPLHLNSTGTIERAKELIQLDFANKYLGGGVLGHGSVQEEIRFVTHPELMISMLFTEVLNPTEALMMIGAERYSEYMGYSRSFEWSGDYVDEVPYDSSCRRRIAVLAIDAMPFRNKAQEYRPTNIIRELNKAWVGFSFYTDNIQTDLHYPGVATGNWGCGAFGGTPQLKALIQLMACAVARRPMAYYTFEDTELRDSILNMYETMARHDVTVAQLFDYLADFGRTAVDRSELYTYLHLRLREQKSRAPRNVPDPIAPLDIARSGTSDPILNELQNNSPDLFSQDDDNEPASGMEPAALGSPPSKTRNERTEIKMSTSGPSNMAPVDDKMAANHTSRFFEEMQKLDDANGISIPVSHTMPVSNRSGVNAGDSNVSMDCDNAQITPEVKKKITKKITDYFKRNNI